MTQNGSTVPWDPTHGVPLTAVCARPEKVCSQAESPLVQAIAQVLGTLCVASSLVWFPSAVMWAVEVLR